MSIEQSVLTEQSQHNPTVSIVATMYRSAQYVEPFYRRCLAALNELNITDYEFVLVDDGSPDDSLAHAVGLSKLDGNVKVVELSRNFGHHKAMVSGLEQASGDNVFLIDIDLEEPPELLIKFWQKMYCQTQQDCEIDVVYGVQMSRKGDWLERWTGSWYYSAFNRLADDIQVERNLSTVRLMRKEYVQQLLGFKEQEFYFGPVCALVGFKQVPVTINKVSHSATTYHFFKKYNLFINSIFAFSKKPLYFIFYFGLMLTMLSFTLGSVVLLRKIFFGGVLDGWTSIMVSIWFLGGVIIMFLGVIAIYLSKIFSQTKQRPFTVVRKVHQHTKRSNQE